MHANPYLLEDHDYGWQGLMDQDPNYAIENAENYGE
jgi:hypothetical protein